MIGLLDVNVLVALTWPAHVHHERAHRWFERNRRAGWATCPSTQAGFVRVVSNPAFSAEALTPREAWAHLEAIVALPGHVFWADDASLVRSRHLSVQRLTGYRQVTDAHLLAVALRHKGALVTLDRGAKAVIPPGVAADVVQTLLE